MHKNTTTCLIGGLNMPTNNGFFKEDEMVYRLNNKYVDLSNNLKNLINALFGVVDENTTIKSEKIDGFIKPDFYIDCNGHKKYVSMKTGRATSVHQELVKNFVLFLRELGISKKTQQTILLYQYGDGTMDGSGTKRFEYEELRLKLKQRIKEANEELNRDKKILMKVVEHCIYLGTQENAIAIDCIYFGTYEYGNVVTRRQLDKYFRVKNWDWMENLHIGPLQLRPHARYINKEIKNPYRREKIEIFWANMTSDLEFISSRYDY